MARHVHDFVSYNVLSSHLSDPGHFTTCRPEDLDPDTRYQRILRKLLPHMERQAVIGLQEVSMPWAGRLHTFFMEHGYTFVHSLYGRFFNGYMGVGMAYPSARYEQVFCDISKVSQTKKWPKGPKDGCTAKAVKSVMGAVSSLKTAAMKVAYGLVLKSYRPPRGPTDVWWESKRRENTMVYLRLRCRSTGGVFGVGTYHMPCAYYAPKVMVIHTALVAQRIQELSPGIPHVLLGDFNFKANDASYALITEGSLDATHNDYPVSPAWDSWRPTLQHAMFSAYKEADGAEPNFTNYAQSRGGPMFCETLDYIFYCSPSGPAQRRHKTPRRSARLNASLSPRKATRRSMRVGGDDHNDEDLYDEDDNNEPVPCPGGTWALHDVLALPHRDTVDGPFPNYNEPSDHILVGASLELVPSNLEGW